MMLNEDKCECIAMNQNGKIAFTHGTQRKNAGHAAYLSGMITKDENPTSGLRSKSGK